MALRSRDRHGIVESWRSGIFRCVKHSPDMTRRKSASRRKQSLLAARRKQSLLSVVRKTFVEQPVEKLCMQEVATRSGVSLWALRYSFESGDALFREVMRDLVRTVAAKCRYPVLTQDSVIETIRSFAEFAADLVSTAEYRDLLYFIVRYGRYHRWLEEAYKQDVVKKLHEELELAVMRTGQRAGNPVLFRKGAVLKFHRTIETAFGLAPLLHADCERLTEGSERVLKEATDEAFGATYLFQWEPATAA